MLNKTILSILQYDDTNTFSFMNSFGNTLIIILLILFIWYIFAIILANWVYKDAQKRIYNENIWILIVLISGIIGFLLYILHRDEEIIHEEEIDAEDMEDLDDVF